MSDESDLPSGGPYVGAHQHSNNHRAELMRSELCGCFYCLSIYPPARIEEWVDEVSTGVGTTAICPECGIDSVIGTASGFPVTREFLRQMRAYWF